MVGSSSAKAIRTSSIGMASSPARRGLRPVDRMPADAFEVERRVGFEHLAQVAGACQHAAGHPPGDVGVDLDRHRDPLDGPQRSAVRRRPWPDPSVPADRARWSRPRRFVVPAPRTAVTRGQRAVGCSASGQRARSALERASASLSSARAMMPGSVRLWLVSTAMVTPLVGQPAHRRSGSRAAGRSGRASVADRCRRAGRRGRTARRAVALGRATSSTIVLDGLGSRDAAAVQGPRPARDVAGAWTAMPPAPPAAVTTEVNGTIGVPSASGRWRGVHRGALEAIAVGDRAARLLARLVVRVRSSPSGSKKRVRNWSAERRAHRRARRACPGRGSSCSSSASRGPA